MCIYVVEFVSLGCVTTLFPFRDIVAVAGSWSIYIMDSSSHRNQSRSTKRDSCYRCTLTTILFYSNEQNPAVSIYPSSVYPTICLSVCLWLCLLLLMQCFFLPKVTEELYRTHKLMTCHTRLNSSTQH